MRVRFDRFVFDDVQHDMTRDGVRVDLSPKAFALLRRLIEARQQAVTREALYKHLWPDTFVEPGNLHTLISEIRTALGDHEHAIVRTVHRVGYAFVATTQEVEPQLFSVVLGHDEIALSHGENRIGRDSDCAIVIDAPEVSRHHATLVVRDGTITLHDLGSKNGTHVRGERVTTAVELHAEDEIVISTFTLRVLTRRMLAATITA